MNGVTTVNDGLTRLATISVSGVIGVTDFSATGSETKGDATADLITVKGSLVGKNGFTLTDDASFGTLWTVRCSHRDSLHPFSSDGCAYSIRHGCSDSHNAVTLGDTLGDLINIKKAATASSAFSVTGAAGLNGAVTIIRNGPAVLAGSISVAGPATFTESVTLSDEATDSVTIHFPIPWLTR